MNRRGGGYDENITLENQEYLNNLLIEKYSLKDSPLKDAPWKRGEYIENTLYVLY